MTCWNRQPVRPLTARWKLRPPEAVKAEYAPQPRTEPDLAPVSHVPHRQAIHADDLPVAHLQRAVLEAQLQLAHLAVIA